MSTVKFDTLQNAAGSKSVPVATVVDGSAKAWVNFNGTGTVAIRASFNVSSVTDNAVGNYTINFTTALSSSNFCAVGMCDITSGSGSPRGVAINASGSGGVAPTVSSLKVATGEEGTNFADVARVCVAVFD